MYEVIVKRKFSTSFDSDFYCAYPTMLTLPRSMNSAIDAIITNMQQSYQNFYIKYLNYIAK